MMVMEILMMMVRSVMLSGIMEIVMRMVVIIRIHRTAKHGSTTLSNLLLKITASQELNGTQVLQINIILFTEIAPKKHFDLGIFRLAEGKSFYSIVLHSDCDIHSVTAVIKCSLMPDGKINPYLSRVCSEIFVAEKLAKMVL